MEVSGKVVSIDKASRLMAIDVDGNIRYYHLTNKNFKDFKAYLSKKSDIVFNASEEYISHNDIDAHEVDRFIKITLPNKVVSYDLHSIQNEVRDFVNQEHNRMFLDLEFSLPGNKSISEIIQYGLVLEDKDGKVILQRSSLIRPMYSETLNKRTLEFLSRKQEDFEDAISYIEFYQDMEKLIKEYDPKILAWGKNDGISMEKSFKLNHLHPLDVKYRYINLMQVIKNYYNYKQEIGLFNTYQDMAEKNIEDQIHDALEDADVERRIFHLFKDEINKKA